MTDKNLPTISLEKNSNISTKIFYIATVAIIILSFFFGSFLVTGDGSGYYYLYRQTVEGNWTFTIPEYPALSPGSHIFVPANNGELTTYFQIGAPFTWAMFAQFFSGFNWQRLEQYALTFDYPSRLMRDGMMILIMSTLFAAGIIFILTRTLHSFLNFKPHHALAASIVTFLALPTWFYAFQSPSYSHIVELFFLTLALFLFMQAITKRSDSRLAISSIFIGLAALTRIDAIIYLLPLTVTAMAHFKRRLRSSAILLMPVLGMVIMQFVIWLFLFGSILPTTAYTSQHFSLFPLHSADVLFSGDRGFFVWSPLAIIGIAGLLMALKTDNNKRKIFAYLGIVCFISFTLFYGSWKAWWGGAAFGQRFLIPLFPFIAMGMAFFLEWLASLSFIYRAIGRFVIVALMLFNMILALIYMPLSSRIEIIDVGTPKTIVQYTFLYYELSNLNGWESLARGIYWFSPRPLHLYF